MKMSDMIELGRGVQALYSGLNQLEERFALEIAMGMDPRLAAMVTDHERPSPGQRGRLDGAICAVCDVPAGR